MLETPDPSSDVDEILEGYLRSAAFLRLAPSTRREYARIAEHLSVDIGAVSLSTVRRKWVREQRDRWATSGHRAATLRLQLLKNATQPLVDDEILPLNLFQNLNRVRGPGQRAEPHPVWREDELGAVLRGTRTKPGLVRAIGLARYAGLRRSDLCRIPNDARVTETVGVRLRWQTGKGDVAVNHLEDPRLTRLLDVETHSCGDLIAYNRDGRPWKPRQLSQALKRVLERLAARGEVRDKLTWHGLRHTRGVELAEAGCSDAIIMAQLGHTTDRSAQLYRRQTSRRVLGDLGQGMVNARLSPVAGGPLKAERQDPAPSAAYHCK